MNPLRHITALLLSGISLAAGAQTVLEVRDTITDPDFVFPESYEADTHRMLCNWYMQNYTTLDNESRPTVDIPATDEEYIARLSAMPTTIEMPFNSLVKSCIEMYTQRRRTQVERMLGMSLYYMPFFEEALEREGMPMELKYLPIIESALNPNAVSRAGATGLWQFMLPTARGLGLEINSLVDERRDPLKSSEAAAKYLKELYGIYNDWSLAIAAYNCGPGNVNKAIRRAGEGKKDFWEIYPYLPRETRGYVPAFISAVYTMNYYDRHNIPPTLARRPIITDTVHVSKRVHFQQIADVLNISIDEIRILNPQYRKDVIPGDQRPYVLTLPHYQTLCYVVSEDSIVAHNAALYARRTVVEPSTGTSRISDDGNYIITENVQYHKVRRGDTFSKLARRYGVTISSIKRANNIRTLRAGRTIKIITTKRERRPQQETADTVQPTDSIATEEVVVPVTYDNAVTVAEDSSDNDKPTEGADGAKEVDEIEGETEVASEASESVADDEEPAEDSAARQVEQTFSRAEAQTQQAAAQEPAPSATQSQQSVQQSQNSSHDVPSPVYHKVRKGETLSKIARRYGTTVKSIQQLNSGLNPSKIQAGQRIRVK